MNSKFATNINHHQQLEIFQSNGNWLFRIVKPLPGVLPKLVIHTPAITLGNDDFQESFKLWAYNYLCDQGSLELFPFSSLTWYFSYSNKVTSELPF